MSDVNAFLWSERFRPTRLDDVIIPESVKKQFRQFIEQKQLPNLLLTSSTAGTGKTTSARVLCSELGIQPLFINASLNNSIDDIRMTVMQYATTMSLYDDVHKVVILDESDRISQSGMDALKGIIEEVHSNCRFVLTANNKNKIIAPLQSRTTHIEFVFSKTESDRMMAQMYKRVLGILKETNTEYDVQAVAGIVRNFFPDNRSLLNFLQMEAASGNIDEGSLAKAASATPEALVEAMKGKKYKEVQSYILNNSDRLNDDFYYRVMKVLEGKITDQSIPQLVLILGEYQKHDSVVPNRYIHFLAMCTEIMMQVSFK